MSTLISIDPGLSTGVAVFRGDQLVETMTLDVGARDQLRRLLTCEEVVCERGPAIRRQADACEPVEALVMEHARTVHWVRPTAWKPSPRSVLTSSERKLTSTKHERDAARMGRWFLTLRKAESDTVAAAG